MIHFLTLFVFHFIITTLFLLLFVFFLLTLHDNLSVSVMRRDVMTDSLVLTCLNLKTGNTGWNFQLHYTYFSSFLDTYQSSQRVKGGAASHNTISLLFERTEADTNLISQRSLLPAAALCYRSVSITSISLPWAFQHLLFWSLSLPLWWLFLSPVCLTVLLLVIDEHVVMWRTMISPFIRHPAKLLYSKLIFLRFLFFIFCTSCWIFDEWIYHTCHWYPLYISFIAYLGRQQVLVFLL